MSTTITKVFRSFPEHPTQFHTKIIPESGHCAIKCAGDVISTMRKSTVMNLAYGPRYDATRDEHAVER